MMTGTRIKGPDRVRRALRAANIEAKVTELPASTRTAAEAANAIGCTVGQIAKSLVFISRDGEEAVLVITSGSNRVDKAKLARVTGQRLLLASAEFVRKLTGFAIGGVPPLGHRSPVPTYFDRDLLSFDEIWAAAGSPHAVFQVDPETLVLTTAARVVDISE